MTTIAIVGAGKGLGAAVAERFGREGFAVALISRNQDRLDSLAAQLGESGVTAKGFAANVRDGDSLRAALEAATEQLGPIEVLQYSPLPAKEYMRPVLETTAEDLVGPVEFSVYGSVNAVRQVLPGMRALGTGTILFVNGGSAVRPGARVTGTSVAFAGESAYAQLLHDAVAEEHVHVGQLIIPFGIDDGQDAHSSAAVAEQLWTIHTERGDFRTYAEPLPE
ncbi:SDR family NAD(P)-dependent oxidoreductase [Curtobacterium sp. C1]|uniref:SDR family NAD(P)-dependent oxidoreductase n=1 Tax=Curtobacterium TaxID=2034 RepID=UPI001E4B817F|nr:SDR family NAD(P)-dependent oxidoreductase [Curtobacterium sp. C1]MCS5486239.1 SDR family NAD(P)-dependent oxidoreductase [Curtobacterium flaccumfaciens pv. basellae]UFU14066.1 SDR family NAD(P)-dependent oxidoreductase [Curtobacterium sp. C1]